MRRFDLSKDKQQYLLTLQVSSYCCLILHDRYCSHSFGRRSKYPMSTCPKYCVKQHIVEAKGICLHVNPPSWHVDHAEAPSAMIGIFRMKVNPYNAEISVHKPWRSKGFFNLRNHHILFNQKTQDFDTILF